MTAQNGTPAPWEGTVALRRRILLTAWLAAAGLLLVRAAGLQIADAHEWRAEAERQHRTHGSVDAPRGAVLDRSGVPLALSHETFRVSVAPHEIRSPEEAIRLLADALELSEEQARRAVLSDRRWVPLAGRFPPSARDRLASARGIYVERELRRFYPHGTLTRGIMGAVVDGRGAGGVEETFEEHLRGVPGMEVMARDPEGRPIPGETWLAEAPRSGGEVTLTLDVDLQEIAFEALAEAVEETGARGGDLLVTDPRTGEILAMVSLRDGSANHLSALNTPYEPGSTLKPFTVATLLRLGRAGLADSVDTGEGRMEVQGRLIRDVHRGGVMSLAQVLQRSSNVGMARMVERLTPEEQYEGLRDFGFGAPTGIELPGEAAGTLRRPGEWSRQSPASLAIGYEVAVTPLQIAMAYGALANGGVLLEPRIVRDLRDERGRVVRTFGPRAVRRVLSEEVAREVTGALVGAVEEGTGTQARLATFAVAGKSGTSRAYRVAGGYEAGAYYSSFVGFFPAEDPQLVVLVRLDRPQGAYFGGLTAAPVTRTTMEAVLAARKPPLDRRALAAVADSRERVREGFRTAMPRSEPAALFAARRDNGEVEAAAAVAGQGEAEVVVPDLRGVAPRTAARRLHALGLAVIWEGAGDVRAVEPAPGTVLLPGDTVRLVSGRGGRSPPPPGGRDGDG